MNRRTIKASVIMVCLICILFAGILLYNGLTPRKLILVGIDGGDWKVIDSLITAGEMPNMARIISNGSRGVLLAPENYISSPPSWTTIATGKKVSKHGVVDVVPRNQVPATPFWEAAIKLGKRICCINWICNYQARVPEGSALISGPYKVSVSPTHLTERIDRIVGTYQNDVSPRQVSLEFLQDAIEVEEQRVAVALDFLEDGYDIFAVTFTGTDRISHFFWKFHELRDREISREDREKFGRAIEDMYIKVDENLGKILSKMDAQTNLIVLSDHGFQLRDISQYEFKSISPNYLFLHAGLAEMQYHGTPVKALSLAWEEDTEDSVNGLIRMNPERLNEMESVAGVLSSFRIEGDSEPVFTDIIRNDNHLTFVRRQGMFPANARASFVVNQETVQTNAESLIPPYYVRSGVHRQEGILAMYGRDIRKGHNIGTVHGYDIAPTVLYLVGLPYAQDMDGQVLLDSVKNAFKLINRISTVTTFDNPDEIRQIRMANMEGKADEVFDEEIEARMRALGYVQ